MYQHASLPMAAGAAATLPFTGLSVIWIVLAGVALLALGGAVRRLLPRSETD